MKLFIERKSFYPERFVKEKSGSIRVLLRTDMAGFQKIRLALQGAFSIHTDEGEHKYRFGEFFWSPNGDGFIIYFAAIPEEAKAGFTDLFSRIRQYSIRNSARLHRLTSTLEAKGILSPQEARDVFLESKEDILDAYIEFCRIESGDIEKLCR